MCAFRKLENVCTFFFFFRFGLNNILFIQIAPAKQVHTKCIEDLNEIILLTEFISSCSNLHLLFCTLEQHDLQII